MYPKPILYLDFDGVLHHENVFVTRKQGLRIQEGHSLFEWAPVLVALLESHPQVDIVLSTSWVRARSFNFAKSSLPKALGQRVVGATFHRREMRMGEFLNLSRGEQIAADVYRRGVSGWFAIDDDDENWPAKCRDRLVKTDPERGLSDPAVQDEVRRMLLARRDRREV